MSVVGGESGGERFGAFVLVRRHGDGGHVAELVLDRPKAMNAVSTELARSLGRPYLESCANFVCVDFGSSEAATAIMNALLARGVFIRKPSAPPLDRFVRISVGTPAEGLNLEAVYAGMGSDADLAFSRDVKGKAVFFYSTDLASRHAPIAVSSRQSECDSTRLGSERLRNRSTPRKPALASSRGRSFAASAR